MGEWVIGATFWGTLRDYHRDLYPHSLLRTRESLMFQWSPFLSGDCWRKLQGESVEPMAHVFWETGARLFRMSGSASGASQSCKACRRRVASSKHPHQAFRRYSRDRITYPEVGNCWVEVLFFVCSFSEGALILIDPVRMRVQQKQKDNSDLLIVTIST